MSENMPTDFVASLKTAGKIVVILQSDYQLPETVLTRLLGADLSPELSLYNWHKEPELTWSAVELLRREFAIHQPRPVHHLLRKLKEEEKLHQVFSLDWGYLERQVGVPKEKIVKVYGNFDRAFCDSCCHLSSKSEYEHALEFRRGPLTCPEWECRRNLMRPNLVLDGGRFTKDYLLKSVTCLPGADLVLCFLENPSRNQNELESLLTHCSRKCNIFCVATQNCFVNERVLWIQEKPDEVAQHLLEPELVDEEDTMSHSLTEAEWLELSQTLPNASEQCKCQLF